MGFKRILHSLCLFIPTPSASLLGFVLISSFICQGCGEDWQAETYPAQGRMTINGEPAEGAVVTLHPVAEKVDKRRSKPWAIVREDGTFTLRTYERGDGAPPGKYKVAIKWPRDVTDLSGAMMDRLGGTFSRPEQSQWTVTIEKGENDLPPIEIKGAEVQSAEDLQIPQDAPPGPNMGD